jgi:hypothetical protein
VRGRNRPDAPQPESATRPQRMGHALPLRGERGSTELRIEAQAVLLRLSLDCEVNKTDRHASYAEEIEELAHARSKARANPIANPSADDLWTSLSDLLFYYDAHVQDTLSARSDRLATAYLLGRGLAEAYWALDSNPTKGSVRSWAFLLGSKRCAELSRSIGRLSGCFSPYTAPAISGSLAAWQEVAGDSKWRSLPAARPTLYLQIRRWYELLILGQDPSTLVRPYAILKSWRGVTQAISTFAGQLLLLGGSLAVLIALAFLAPYGKTSATANTVLGLLSVLGITTAAVQANLKNRAQAIATRLRQDVYTDLVAGEITLLPSLPHKSAKRMHTLTVRACENRLLTTEASA